MCPQCTTCTSKERSLNFKRRLYLGNSSLGLYIIHMKMIDIILESSSDLKRHRDLFMNRWQKIMKAKSRTIKISYTEKLLKEMLTKDEIRFLVLQLQKK